MGSRERIKKIIDECDGVWSQSGVSDWEKQRLLEWQHWSELSPKQVAILDSIEQKVFGDE